MLHIVQLHPVDTSSIFLHIRLITEQKKVSFFFGFTFQGLN